MAGLLTPFHSDHLPNAVASVVIDLSSNPLVKDLEKVTAAGTVLDLHEIPF